MACDGAAVLRMTARSITAASGVRETAMTRRAWSHAHVASGSGSCCVSLLAAPEGEKEKGGIATGHA